MKFWKYASVVLFVLLLASSQVFACTILAVGKDASADGSTMTSHTCDSNSDDFRLWLIPSMPAGTVRDIVLDGRAGSDFTGFPESNTYGPRAMILDTYTFEKPTNQYLHGMYSFANDKGLAMGESTCGFERGEQGTKLRAAFGKVEGIYDCYMLQDLALETCSTAREAVEFMGKMVDEYGWNGSCECINICDGNEVWVMEVYGGNIWCAVRIPDDAVFVAANRARIIHIDFDDPENYLYSANIKSFAIENDLWDGKGDFEPCNIYAPNKSSLLCTLREWRVLMLLDPSLNLLPPTVEDPDNYPMWVVPKEKVSVQTVHEICSDWYAGTEFDVSRTVYAGPFGNPLGTNYVYRPINMCRCTYIQCSNIKSWLPDAAKCLVWFGWGAPSTTYLTPLFASMTELPEFFYTGVRNEPFREDSGWWVCSGVQQDATINYEVASEVIKSIRDPRMETIYKLTDAIQTIAASMIDSGNEEGAIKLLTAYACDTAEDWHEIWIDLDKSLRSKLMFGNVDMRSPSEPQWWLDIVNEYTGDKLRPLAD